MSGVDLHAGLGIPGDRLQAAAGGSGGAGVTWENGRERYAVYYAPGRGTTLWRMGCRWLGRDAEGGPVPPRPAVAGFDDAALDAVTAAPRRYGFHATLKPPFALAAGRTPAELEGALAQFCRDRRPVRLPPLKVAVVEDFLALIPAGPCEEVSRLAADCVRAFDGFRAPPSPEEMARRRAAGLTPRQDELLSAWGYPFVMDAFRLHLTLTDRLPGGTRKRLEPVLADLFRDALAEPAVIDGLSLFHESVPGQPCDLVRRIALAGAA